MWPGVLSHQWRSVPWPFSAHPDHHWASSVQEWVERASCLGLPGNVPAFIFASHWGSWPCRPGTKYQLILVISKREVKKPRPLVAPPQMMLSRCLQPPAQAHMVGAQWDPEGNQTSRGRPVGPLGVGFCPHPGQPDPGLCRLFVQ